MVGLQTFALAVALTGPAWALTSARINVNIHDLEGDADEVVEVNLDGKSLEEGSKLLAIRDGLSAPIKGLLGGLKGIYRKTYRFSTGKSYEEEAVNKVRQRMTDDGWSPMLDVQDRAKKESVTVYSYVENGVVTGFTVLSSDPSEVTVVNIVGDLDLDTLVDLGEQLGVPSMRIATIELNKRKAPLPEKPKK